MGAKSLRKDKRRMGRAIALARLNHGLTGDNPSVGCVIVDAMGHVVGEGVTGLGGRPHAEEIALEEAGNHARGGTAYVTLEPCRERTSGGASCSQKLIEAQISRVVCATRDPHPTAKDGLARLKTAKIALTIGIRKPAADRLYQSFFDAIKL